MGKLLVAIATIVALQTQVIFAAPVTEASSTDSTRQLAAYTDPSSPDAQEILWLARIVYSESKTREEQIMVAWVVRNRVETKYRGADTYKEVANDPSQFSGLTVVDAHMKTIRGLDYGDTKNKSWTDAISIARAVYFAEDTLRPIAQSVRHFYSPGAVLRDPSWATSKKPAMVLRNTNGAIQFAFYDGVK